MVIQRLLEKDVTRRISANELLKLIPNFEDPPVVVEEVPQTQRNENKNVKFGKITALQGVGDGNAQQENVRISTRMPPLESPKSILKKPSEANVNQLKVIPLLP